VGAPQNAIWNGVAVTRIHVGFELDGGHAMVGLDNRSGQPIVNMAAVMDVVA
jgi:hypothetical protein